jgi:Clp amino terminal domain, pathogenicity island component
MPHGRQAAQSAGALRRAGWHPVGVGHAELSEPYLNAIRRAFDVARETGCGCRPVHFLVGIAETDGPAGAALTPAGGRTLRSVVVGLGRVADGAPAAYLHMQAQDGACALAGALGQPVTGEHLLVALLDQGTPEVLGALGRAGLDPGAVRRAALAALGAADDRPAIVFAPLAAAGTLDRPALPVADLDPRAWAVLRWRQDHLPLGRLHRRSDTEALVHLERAAVWRLADRQSLGDDQRFSLTDHHERQVAERVARARPELSGPRDRPGRLQAMAVTGRRPRSRVLRFTVGWRAWVSNRQTGWRDRWFRLRTVGAYRGAPQP